MSEGGHGQWATGCSAGPRATMLLAFLVVGGEFLAFSKTGVNPNDAGQPLKLLISIQQQAITWPSPARVTLHFHNAGRETLWLYRRARSPAPVLQSPLTEEASKQTTGGSVLSVHLVPAQTEARNENKAPAHGRALESVGLPHPKLVRLAPSEDAEEKIVLRLEPALAETTSGKEQRVWGQYQLSVTYAANFSTADEALKNLGVVVWQGEVSSNTIELEMRPPAEDAQGSVEGTVLGSDGQPRRDVLVSLSDQQERLVDQVLVDLEGHFSFHNLPLGLYWVTARRPDSSTDTTVFRHAELSSTQPSAAFELVMLPVETYEPKGLLHKPVLVRVTDSAGRPLAKVVLEVTWSSGTVLENVKGQTGEDGTVALELIPGRNFATLRRRGCPNEEQRLDVAEGSGIDDFKLVFECSGN